MLLASVLTARWVFQRLWAPTSWWERLASGVFALCLMLLAEFKFLLWFRGLTIREYLQSRDPVSGTAYFMSLAVFCCRSGVRGKRTTGKTTGVGEA